VMFCRSWNPLLLEKMKIKFKWGTLGSNITISTIYVLAPSFLRLSGPERARTCDLFEKILILRILRELL
jgi:hypothetical protein